MDHYETTTALSGRAEEAVAAAQSVAVATGFTIEQRTATSAGLTGPGMNSTNQNPLLGASRIDLQAEGRQLRVTAELGGVERMARFLRWFPPLLALGLIVVFAIVFPLSGLPFAAVALAAGITMLTILPWLVLGPILTRRIRARTEAALDSLAANAAQLSQP